MGTLYHHSEVKKLIFLGGPYDGEYKNIGFKGPSTQICVMNPIVELTNVLSIQLMMPTSVVYEYRKLVIEDNFYEAMVLSTMPEFEAVLRLGTLFQLAPVQDMIKSTKWARLANDRLSELSKLIPGLLMQLPYGYQLCPKCKQSKQASKNSRITTVQGMIIHLNDTEGFSFEQIADYLETLPIDLTVKEEKDAPS